MFPIHGGSLCKRCSCRFPLNKSHPQTAFESDWTAAWDWLNCFLQPCLRLLELPTLEFKEPGATNWCSQNPEESTPSLWNLIIFCTLLQSFHRVHRGEPYSRAWCPTNQYWRNTTSLVVPKTFDMVWSVEFLEHVNLHNHFNYISTTFQPFKRLLSSWGPPANGEDGITSRFTSESTSPTVFDTMKSSTRRN